MPGPTTDDWTPSSVQLLDFNGDGRPDVAGAFDGRIEFRPGVGDGTFAAGYLLPAEGRLGEVTVGTFDADRHDDAIVPGRHGFLVWRGQAQGPPLQPAFETIYVDRPVWVVPLRHASSSPAGLLLPMFDVNERLHARIHVYAGAEDDAIHGIFLGASLADMPERVPVADFDEDGNDEVVLAPVGARKILVYGIEFDVITKTGLFLGGYGSVPGVRTVPIDAPRACRSCDATLRGYTLSTETFVADVDGDGLLDIIANVEGPQGEPRVAVAKGNAAGRFDAAYIDGRFVGLRLPVVGVGDIDADSVADFALRDGIYFASSSPFEPLRRAAITPEAIPGSELWTSATFADVDGDAWLDVVAFREGSASVDVLLCQSNAGRCDETRHFIGRRFSSESGFVTHVRTGALQGLAVSDIVIASSDGTADTLGVLYGRAGGFPEPPQVRGRFHRIRKIELARAPRFGDLADGEGFVDLSDDVQLHTERSDGSILYSHLYADAWNGLSSPLLLPTASGGLLGARPMFAVAGNFEAAELGSDDLILAGTAGSGVPALWWAPRAVDGAFLPPAMGEDLRDVFGADFELRCARLAAGDVDADGWDEMIVVSAARCGTGRPQLAVGRVADGAVVFDLITEPPSDFESGAVQLTVTDLDGDGDADVVLAGEVGVRVYRGGPTGLATEPHAVDSDLGGEVVDLTPLAGGAGAVALLIADGVALMNAERAVRVLDIERGDAEIIRSADLDADGLGDILLIGPQGVSVFFSVPAGPLGDDRGARR